MNRRQAAAEARRSLDRTLEPFHKAPRRPPARGWIRAIRDALGMTAEQLGQRIGVSQPSVQRLERSEAEGTIQLSSLRRVAEALDCEVVYALVPRRSLQVSFDAAARAAARRELGHVGHTMALEDQAVDDDDERLSRYIAEELELREIWAHR